MKKFLVVMIFVLLFVACAPVDAVSPDQVPSDEKLHCTHPESDNGLSWSINAQVCYDTQVYTLSVQVLGELSSNQSVSGSMSGFGYGGYGSVSGRIWTDGKGILPVQILSIYPTADWINTSLPYLLKTTDLGAMGLPSGATVTLVCNHDVEVLSPVFSGQTLTTDRLTDELDDCRLDSKNYVPSQ